VDAGLDRDLQLGADAVVGGDQHRIPVAAGLEVEETAEAAELGVGADARGRLGERRDATDERVAGLDVDAGPRIGPAVLAL